MIKNCCNLAQRCASSVIKLMHFEFESVRGPNFVVSAGSGFSQNATQNVAMPKSRRSHKYYSVLTRTIFS